MANKSATALEKQLFQISEKCKSCKLCNKECAFLKKYGTPKDIADNFALDSRQDALRAYECHLCSLCAAVCPFEVEPAKMFLEMRRWAYHKGWADLASYKKLLSFEGLGKSKLFRHAALPNGCKTVLFPGCALSASRSAIVKELYLHLRQNIPHLGLFLDCCTKPSHDLGRADYFHDAFTGLKDDLLTAGVNEVLVACPSCYKVFKEYGAPLTVRSVYEKLAAVKVPARNFNLKQPVTFHDSCTARFEDNILSSVRQLAKSIGLEITEMKHHGQKALCCGEGGGACFVAPNMVEEWKRKRKEQMADRLVMTYCAGCANFIGNKKARHILDMVFSKEIANGKMAKIAKAPFTYLHRLKLKLWAKRNIPVASEKN